LIVIGVHAPEFAFEQDVDTVAHVLQERRINYAIAIDNNFAVWRAFSNRYWPYGKIPKLAPRSAQGAPEP
jgi:hypothetical protein